MERYMMILKSIKRMNPKLEDALRNGVFQINLDKGMVLDSAPGTNDNLYFIEKGLFHFYHSKVDTKLSLEFRWEDHFFNMIESFLGIRRDPELKIEALEESIVWCFPATLIKELFETDLHFWRYYLEIGNRNFFTKMQAIECSRPGKGADNFRYLSSQFPNMLRRVPVQYLANLVQLQERELTHLLKSPIKIHADSKRRRRSRRNIKNNE